MVVKQAIYPITVDVLYSIFGPFGVEQLVVYPPTKSDEGEPCVAADVRFSSAHAAAHAMAYWDGRYIYYRCCCLQMWNASWNATADIRLAPTSPPARTAAPDPPSPPPSQETTNEEWVPVPDVSSPTKAKEVLELIPDTSTTCLARAPVTCATDGSRQVATMTVYPEPAVDLNKELEQLIPARATLSIGADTSSITEEVVPRIVATTNVGPKAGLQEMDALSGNTSSIVTSKENHIVVSVISTDSVAPTLTVCLTQCSSRDATPVMFVLHPAMTFSWLVLRPKPWPSFWRDRAGGTEDNDYSYFIVRLFRSMKNLGTLSTELSSKNGLQLMWLKQSPRDEPLNCIQDEQMRSRHPPDHATHNAEVQSTMSHLQNTMQCWAFDISAGFNVTELEGIFHHGIVAIHVGCLFSSTSQQEQINYQDWATSDATQLSQDHYIQAVTPGTFSLGSFSIHAGHMIYMSFNHSAWVNSEAILWEQVSYKDLQFFPSCLVQPLEGGEHFIHCGTAYALYLEMLALVSKMWKSNHCWVSLLCLVQLYHLFLGILGSTTSYTFHVNINCWVEQQNGRTSRLIVAVEPTLRPLHMRILMVGGKFRKLISTVTAENYSSGGSVMYPDSVQGRRVQYTGVKSKKFTSNILLCLGIHLVGNITILIQLDPCFTQSKEPSPLLQPEPCTSIPTNFAIEFRSNLRANSESLHITGVLSKLMKFWGATHSISTSSFGIHLVGTLLIMIELGQYTNPCLFGKRFVESGSNKNSKVVWQISKEYFWKECVIGALIMPFLFSPMSNLCSAGGIIFSSCDSFNSLRNGDQLNSRESTTATCTLTLTTSIQFMFSVRVQRSGPLCDNVHSSSDQGARNSTDKREVLLIAPYEVRLTRCLKLVIEGPSESLQVFQLKPTWHHYVRACAIRKFLAVARISTSGVQFNSMGGKAPWAFAEMWSCKNWHLELLCYNNLHHSFDAKMLHSQEMELCTTVVDLLPLPNQ